MTSREIRRSFLEFFERSGHRIVPSSPLAPADDPTLLFTNAGMNQFKDLFLGRERRAFTRATTSQKVMRVSGKHNDLDNVGPSLRHHTFFEMLGNFSFGDYFKDEAITYAWTLLTDVWGLPPERLHATIFAGEAGIPRDDDAYRLWQRYAPDARIHELGLADNFWAMGDTGPCGRCSELHYHRGDHLPCPEPVCRGVVCSCDRYIEIWNNVFMEFERSGDGTLAPLPAPSIDTGMGLERITAVLQDKLSNYDTDVFASILAAIGGATGTRYGADDRSDVSMRVIADHLRAMTFLIGDGVIPSNEWRGYVLRKIMRRAMRHGKRLGATQPFLHTLVDVVIGEMDEAYPELGEGREGIVQVVRAEEDRFDAVLNAGLPRLEEALDRAAASGVLAGDEAFRLYDSLGMPLDFMEDLAQERGLSLDQEGFDRAMGAQRERGRAGSMFDTKRGPEAVVASDDARQRLEGAGDRFEGYTTTRLQGSQVVALFDEDQRQVTELASGAEGYLALSATPFYLESGGQVSDRGAIEADATGARAEVVGMARLAAGWPRAHRVRVTAGAIRERDLVSAEVDAPSRDATRRHHTATHLLHAALRRVLGTHVKQAGSLVAPDRLRFDFVHFAPVTREQLDEIERLVNEQILRNAPVQTEVRSTQEAIAGGAMALFGEKYGDRVRVVSIPDFSTELCGGTHVNATGDIGSFAVISEGGVAAGTRRIEAVTGMHAVALHQAQRSALDAVVRALNVAPDQAADAVQRLQQEAKRLTRDVSALKLKAAAGGGPAQEDEAVLVAGTRLIARRVAGLDKDALRGLADTLKSRLKSGLVVLASDNDGKVAIVVSVTGDLAKKIPAGQVVKQLAPIIGGAGGGRGDFAEAGGKDPSRIDELLAKSREVVADLMGRGST